MTEPKPGNDVVRAQMKTGRALCAHLKSFCMYVATLMLVSGVLTGQQEAAAPRGVVLDGSGAVVSGAIVVFRDASGGVLSSTVTGNRGEFQAPTGVSGIAELQVTAVGFRAQGQTLTDSGSAGSSEIVIRLIPDIRTESITVSAARTEIPLTALPNSAVLLEKETVDIQRLFSDDLATVLEKTIPSFGPSLRKLAGRAESLRGRNPLYMINGVTQHNALRDGQRDGYTIDMDFLENIEVIQGSNSLQGVGATGGVVNMITKSAPMDGTWRHDLRLALTTHDSFRSNSLAGKGSYLLGKKIGRFDIVGGASLMRRGLFYDAEGRPVGLYPTQGDIMDSVQHNVYTRAGYAITDRQRLSLTYNNFRLGRLGNYVVALGNRAQNRVTSTVAGDPGPVVGDPARNMVHTGSLDYSNQNFLGGNLGVQGFHQNFAARFEGGLFGGFFRLTPDGPAFLDQSEVRSRKNGFKITQSYEESFWAGFTPRFGFDLLDDQSWQRLSRSDRNWVPPATLRSFAPFAQAEQKFGDRLTISGGLRVERARLLVNDYTTIAAANSVFVRGGDPAFTRVLPNIGGVVQLGNGFSLYGSYTEGFTMPDVGRVLRDVNLPGQDVNSLLSVQPVVTNNSEGGLRYRSGRVRADVAWYLSTSDLGSVLQADENGFFNILRQPTRISGFEASADYWVNRFFSLGGNFAQLRGRFDASGDGSIDSDLDGMNVAPNRLNAFLQFFPASWMYGRFQTNTLFDRSFSGPGVRPNTDFSGFTTADLALGFTTRAGLFRVGAENVLDKQYLTYFAQTEPFQRNDTIFAGMGRTFTITFEPRF
jgi:iron complex outermembrane recepter protein